MTEVKRTGFWNRELSLRDGLSLALVLCLMLACVVGGVEYQRWVHHMSEERARKRAQSVDQVTKNLEATLDRELQGLSDGVQAQLDAIKVTPKD